MKNGMKLIGEYEDPDNTYTRVFAIQRTEWEEEHEANTQTDLVLTERFGKDSLIALATVEDGIPHVRTVDAVYIDGAFYVVTYSLSGKIQQIAKNPVVAISGEWFTAHGIGENLGHVLLSENKAVMDILRAAFAAWYDNGHTNEADPNTCLLKIRLTDGVLFAEGTRYDIDFA